MEVLVVKELSVYYGKLRGVRSLNLSLGQGEAVSLMGRNGAGKTSTLRGIMGLVKTRGKVLYRTRPLDGLRPYSLPKMGISYVPQQKRVFDSLTVVENLKLNTPKINQGEIIRDALSLFPELKGHLGQSAASLSGGEQVMLSLAKAMSHSPDLLLLDEPTEGLMPQIKLRLTGELNRKIDHGLSALIAEQNRDFVEKICSRIYMLEEGERADAIEL